MVMRAISSGQILPPKSGYPQQKCLSPRAPPPLHLLRLASGPRPGPQNALETLGLLHPGVSRSSQPRFVLHGNGDVSEAWVPLTGTQPPEEA